jgi:hypothetical protein
MLRLLKALSFTLALATLAVFVGCNSGSSTKARFVNALWNTAAYGGSNGPLDLYVNGAKDFSGVTFATVSPGAGYASVPPGSDTFEAYESPDDTTPVFTQSLTVSSGEQTLVAIGQAYGTFFFMSFPDDNTAPAAGNVNFRVINASDAQQAVDVYIEQTPSNPPIGCPSQCPTISSLAQHSASGYVTLSNPGTGWTIYVTQTGSKTPLPGWFNGFSTGDFGGPGIASIRTLVLTNQDGDPESMSNPPVYLADLN